MFTSVLEQRANGSVFPQQPKNSHHSPNCCKMLKAEKKLQAILKKSQASGITSEELISLQILKTLQKRNSDFLIKHKKCVLKVILGLAFAYFLVTLSNNYSYKCLIEMPIDTSKVFRKSESCDICEGVTEVKRLKNISQSKFEEFYAHTGVPIVVTDGAVKWPALQAFNYNFFKEIYTHDDESSDTTDECQFFPYKTEFHSLRDVFNISDARARLETGTEPWYIGWSNCNDRAGQILRQYYSQPYFLPDNSENIALSWIFMGGPGNGAHMHVDNVVHPSWQAQLSGKKLWRLMPPPECLYHCTEISVTLHPGEIIVVDTNKWYHQTTILEGGVSITIGSEFD